MCAEIACLNDKYLVNRLLIDFEDYLRIDMYAIIGVKNLIKYCFLGCQLLELREKIEGIQILLRLGKETTPVESQDAVEWFKQLCLKPNADFKNPGPVSLYQSIFEALETEYIEKISEANVSDGKELHKKLEKSMLEKQLDSKVNHNLIPPFILRMYLGKVLEFVSDVCITCFFFFDTG